MFDESSIYDSSTRTFNPSYTIPETTMFHNMLKINDTHYFMVNGNKMSRVSYVFDLPNEEWHEMPISQLSHNAGFAGVVTRSDGSKEIVIAGGDFGEVGRVEINAR